MNFDKALGLSYSSVCTEDDFHAYYRAIITALGYANVKRCIPFTLQQLSDAYKKDRHFNVLPIQEWDRAAGFIIKGADCELVGSLLTRLYHNKCGVTTFSCSQGVCILKECARMWLEEEIEKC